MKFFLVTFCLTLVLVSRISSASTCDLDKFRTCYLAADTDAEEKDCLEQRGCEQVAKDFRNPLEIGIPMNEADGED